MSTLVITTVKRGEPIETSGALYLYDWNTQTFIKKQGMLPLNARFARNPRGGIRGLRGVCVHQNKIYVASNDTITVLNKDFEMLYTIEHPLFCNLHEIKASDEGLLIASCGNDALLHCDFNGHVEILFSFEPDIKNFCFNKIDRHGDHRPNSITRHNGTLYTALAKESCIGEIRGGNFCELLSSEQVHTPHNLVFQDKHLYFHSSLESRFCRYNLDTKDIQTLYHDKTPNDAPQDTLLSRWGWLRGLIYTDNKFFMGSSPYARLLCWDNGQVSEIKLSDGKTEAVNSIAVLEQ